MVPYGIKRNMAYQCYLFNSKCNNDTNYNINISFIPFCISCYFDVENFDKFQINFPIDYIIYTKMLFVCLLPIKYFVFLYIIYDHEQCSSLERHYAIIWFFAVLSISSLGINVYGFIFCRI